MVYADIYFLVDQTFQFCFRRYLYFHLQRCLVLIYYTLRLSYPDYLVSALSLSALIGYLISCFQGDGEFSWTATQQSQLLAAYYYGCAFLQVCCVSMMTSSNRNIFRVIGLSWGEFTGHWWIPLTKASDEGLWCLFSSQSSLYCFPYKTRYLTNKHVSSTSMFQVQVKENRSALNLVKLSI